MGVEGCAGASSLAISFLHSGFAFNVNLIIASFVFLVVCICTSRPLTVYLLPYSVLRSFFVPN